MRTARLQKDPQATDLLESSSDRAICHRSTGRFTSGTRRMPRGRSEDALFRDDERRSLSNDDPVDEADTRSLTHNRYT